MVETPTHMSLAREDWRCIRTNPLMERLNREVRRRTRVVGAFPDGQSALMLVAARLRHVADTKWGTRRYLDMMRLREMHVDRLEPTRALSPNIERVSAVLEAVGGIGGGDGVENALHRAP